MSKITDSPDKFPWEYFFSGKEEDYSKAIVLCTSKNTSSLVIKKAVTILNGGTQTGTKEENCDKILNRVKIINSQLSLIKDQNERNSKRQAVINHYRTSLSKKFDESIEISPMPELPFLAAAAPPKRKSKEATIEDDSVKASICINIEDIYKAEAIVYYYNNFPKLSTTAFKEYMANKYPDSLPEKNKKNLLGLYEKLEKKKISKALYTDALEYINKSVNNLCDTDDALPSKPKSVSSPVKGSEKVKAFEDVEELPVKKSKKESKIKVDNIRKIIEKKGWVSIDTEDEADLCNYVVDNVNKETLTIGDKEKEIKEKITKIEKNVEEIVEELKIKPKKKVRFLDQQLEELQKEKTKVKEMKEEVIENIGTCSVLDSWLSMEELDDDYERIIKEELECKENVCDIDLGRCIREKNVTTPIVKILNNKVTGSLDKINKLNEKINQKIEKLKKMKEAEEEIEELALATEELKITKMPSDSEIYEILKELIDSIGINKVSVKKVVNVLNKEYGYDIDKKDSNYAEIKEKINDIYLQFVKEIEEEEEIEELSLATESLKVSDEVPLSIQLGQAQPSIKEDILSISPEEESIEYVEDIEKGVSKVETACNVKEYSNLDELTESLYCPDQMSCDLDNKICVNKNEQTVEINIGDKIVNVNSKEDLVEQIKDKIAKMESPKILEEAEEELPEIVEPKIEEEIKEVEEEEIKEVPIIQSKLFNIEEIAQSLRNILVDKPITSVQHKIKVADRMALEKIAKCVGIRV